MKVLLKKPESNALAMTHESAIHVAVGKGKVLLEDLREAIHFYQEGEGKDLEKPCCRCEWAELLRRVGFHSVVPGRIPGKFRSC